MDGGSILRQRGCIVAQPSGRTTRQGAAKAPSGVAAPLGNGDSIGRRLVTHALNTYDGRLGTVPNDLVRMEPVPPLRLVRAKKAYTTRYLAVISTDVRNMRRGWVT